MENVNEINTNEEVLETAEEIVTSGSGKLFKTLGVFGGVALVGGLAYKLVIKPRLQKKKEAAEAEADQKADEEADSEYVDEEIDSEE